LGSTGSSKEVALDIRKLTKDTETEIASQHGGEKLQWLRRGMTQFNVDLVAYTLLVPTLCVGLPVS
jgi:1-deoxy-D-xylulose 5-phosphate reductoisomerase